MCSRLVNSAPALVLLFELSEVHKDMGKYNPLSFPQLINDYTIDTKHRTVECTFISINVAQNINSAHVPAYKPVTLLARLQDELVCYLFLSF